MSLGWLIISQDWWIKGLVFGGVWVCNWFKLAGLGDLIGLLSMISGLVVRIIQGLVCV